MGYYCSECGADLSEGALAELELLNANLVIAEKNAADFEAMVAESTRDALLEPVLQKRITHLTAELEEAKADLRLMEVKVDFERHICNETTSLRVLKRDLDIIPSLRAKLAAAQKFIKFVKQAISANDDDELKVQLSERLDAAEEDSRRLVDIIKQNLPDIHMTVNQSKWFHNLRAAIDDVREG